jgi:thiamine kinase-like enzyme
VTPDEIVARLWPGRDTQIAVLGGGITNHNFKVTVDGTDAYALRIAGRDTELLGIDRGAEYEASLGAAAVGVGPAVVRYEPGLLVTRFIPGNVVSIERMREPASIRRVAATLRAVHMGPPIPARFNSFRVVEAYRETALAQGGRVPEAYARAAKVAERIERKRGPFPERLCHNDLLNANFIDDGTRIRIVDWEYAGMGDVFFDLANFAINHELDAAQSRLLLEAYFGRVRREDLRSLALMRFMSDFREAMWGVVQTTVSALEFDFAGYAAEHFDRLQRTEASKEFRAAL